MRQECIGYDEAVRIHHPFRNVLVVPEEFMEIV